MEQHISFMNVDTVKEVTYDVSNGKNNLMIEVEDSLGRTSVIVVHPSVFNQMMYLAKDAQHERLFNTEMYNPTI